jgi:hypothetical protein
MRPGSPSRKVAFAYPTGGSVTLPFHASVTRLLWYEAEKSQGERLLSRIFHVAGLYVADNRQLIVEKFLEMDADWLLQVDTDIEFPHDLIERMLEAAGTERRLVAANVPLGSYPSVAFRKGEGVGVWECLPGLVEDVVECDAVATAVILVHRAVFEAIADEAGQCWFHHFYLPLSEEGTPLREFRYRSIGEDVSFCVRAQRCGFGIYAARIPGLRHHKTRPLSEDFERSALMGAQDADPAAMGELLAEG